MASPLPIAGNLVTRHRKYTELEIIDADMTSSPIYSRKIRHIRVRMSRQHTIQLSLFPDLFTSQRVTWPAAWMTKRLQKPSHSWKIGVDHHNILSQPPTVTVSSSPSGPNIQSRNEASSALLPLKVRSTQLVLPSSSTEKRLSDQMSSEGKTSHWVQATSCKSARLYRDLSGVTSRRTE